MVVVLVGWEWIMHLGTKRFHFGQVDVSIRVLKTLVDEISPVMGIVISVWARTMVCSGLMLGVACTAALLDGILPFLLVVA